MPQFETEEVPAPPVVAQPVLPPPPPDVGFGNPHAVRIGILVALLSFLASALSGPIVALPLVWLVAGGFFSVYLYRRRTGQLLTLGSGARLGWMTGLFAFVILLVMLTTVVLAISDPGIAAQLVDAMRARGADVNAQNMLDAFRSPSGILQIVVAFFVIFTLFPTLGGAIGAKLLSGRSR